MFKCTSKMGFMQCYHSHFCKGSNVLLVSLYHLHIGLFLVCILVDNVNNIGF